MMNHIKQYPHCDPRILHAPGTCDVCDMHPDWQELREHWQIAFTGQTPKPLAEPSWSSEGPVLPCPADLIRGKSHAIWGGNRAVKETKTGPSLQERAESARNAILTELPRVIERDGRWVHLQWSAIDWRRLQLETGIRRVRDSHEVAVAVKFDLVDSASDIADRLIEAVKQVMRERANA